MTVEAIQRLIREIELYLPILQRLESERPDVWASLAGRSGIATTNDLVYALNRLHAEQPNT